MVDYRRLHSMTEVDVYGIALINDMFQDEVQKRVFNVLDLKHGYHEMKLGEQSQDCTTMSKPFGTYKWLVLPRGVKNGNAAFQRLLDDALKDYRDFARPFAEDMTLGSRGATYEEAVQNHVKYLGLVLQRPREGKLAVSANKANMFVVQVEFAGNAVGYGVKQPIRGGSCAWRSGTRPTQSLNSEHSSVLPTIMRSLSVSIIIMLPPFTPCSNSSSRKRERALITPCIGRRNGEPPSRISSASCSSLLPSSW